MSNRPSNATDTLAALAVSVPVSPMLASPVSGLPSGDAWIFEPKWDGFRCIAFVGSDDIELGSRNEKPLTRYFPEVVEAIRANVPAGCVLDGEIVIATDHGLDFDQLTQRIHPAASRVKRLAEETPAAFVAFDLLAVGDRDLRDTPFSERRAELERLLADAQAPVHLTPATSDRSLAESWFDDFEGAGLDGLIAKDPDSKYVENKRVMKKIKHERTADCVVAGFRWHKSGPVIGSLLLGIYDEAGSLRHAGITASFTMARRKELVAEIEPLRDNALTDHPWAEWASEEETSERMPGARSRWNAKKDLSWEPLRPETVCEVAYDHLQGERFRHATTFKRWRPDRSPESCNYGQMFTPVPMELKRIFDIR